MRGEEQPDTLAAMTNLVNTLIRAGKVAEAELGRKTFEIKTWVLGPEHAETVISQSSLASCSCQQQKAEGEQVLRAAVEVAERPTSQSRYPRDVPGPAGVLPRQPRPLCGGERSSRQLRDPGRQARPKDARTQETAKDIVKLYERWDKPAQAESWRAKAAP